MPAGDGKAEGALRTISEVSDQLAIPQHILRYWETRFPQLRPLQRAGNRRYYRPEDVALVMRIDRLLNQDGYTIKGVQKLLSARGGGAAAVQPASPPPVAMATVTASAPAPASLAVELREIRARLAAALAGDA